MGTLRKILTTGVGAAILTENSLRHKISSTNLTGQARTYVTQALAGELKKFFSQINLHEEIQKALAGLTFDIRVKVKKNSGS